MKKNIIYFVIIFFSYLLVTLVIFNQRIPNLLTHYAMPDVDTDGGIWYKWFLHYINRENLLFNYIDFIGYPFGYDNSFSQVQNLTDSTELFIIQLLGFNWTNLILITNLSSLLTYPLAGLTAALLCFYITRNNISSFIGGLIFTFSFYHVFMGRGQMSINHIELIPLYFLSLLFFIDKSGFFSLLLSAFTFAILFKSDPYYAFYSGIFSVVILLIYSRNKILNKFKKMLFYYFGLFSITILANFDYVLSNLFLFSAQGLQLTGRVQSPRGELSSVLYYFTPLPFHFINSYSQILGQFFYPLTLVISTVGLLKLNKNKLYLTCMFCLLLSIVLSSYIPALYWINELYFKYFQIFRSVGRLALLSYLFVGIMVAMYINSLMKTKLFEIKKNIFLLCIGVLSVIIIIMSMNSDITWFRQTDFSQIAKLYEPIKRNKDIKVIVNYPIALNFQHAGFPLTYQLMGQIIHEKKLANGAFFTNEQAIAFHKKIKAIEKKETINLLADVGIDTIIIYNNLLPNASTINKQLKKDTRLRYIGAYKTNKDKGYVSASDLSRDISVYNINPAYIKKRDKNVFLFNLENAPYEKISAYKYVITVDPSNQEGKLLFNFPYSDNWKLMEGDLSKSNDLQILFFNSNKSIQATKTNQGLMEWDLPVLATLRPEKYTLFYLPQGSTYLSNKIITTIFILYGIYLLYYFLKHKSIRNVLKKEHVK